MNVANTQIRKYTNTQIRKYTNKSVMRIASGEAVNVTGIDDCQIKIQGAEIHINTREILGNTRSGNVTGIDDRQIKYKKRAFGQQSSHHASILGEYICGIRCR